MATHQEYEAAMMDTQIELGKLQVEKAKLELKKLEAEVESVKADVALKNKELSK